MICLNCKFGGLCIPCLVAGAYSLGSICSCQKPNAGFNFALRSTHIIPSKQRLESREAPGLDIGSTLRSCTLTYKRLSASREKRIQLFRLHPGHHGQPMTISLFVCSLYSCPDYKALSYTWGSANNPAIIQSDTSELFFMTRSLAGALFQLRYTNKHPILWADAVCINQDDKEEKGKQVEIIHHIYSRASQVLI